MGRTLRTIALCAAIAVATAGIGAYFGSKYKEKLQEAYSVLIDNSGYEESADKNSGNLSSKTAVTSSQSTDSNPVAPKPVRRNLEDFFLEGGDPEVMEISLTTKGIIESSELDEENRAKTDERKISRIGFGQYTIPAVEEDSYSKDLILDMVEYESTEDRKRDMDKGEIVAPYPFFAKENIVGAITPTITDSEYLSPQQKELYNNFLREFAEKTGAEVTFSENPEEQARLEREILGSSVQEQEAVSESNSDSNSYHFDEATDEEQEVSSNSSSSNETSEENNTGWKINSNPTSIIFFDSFLTNRINDPANRAMKNYIFNDEEMKDLIHDSIKIERTNLDNPAILVLNDLRGKNRENFEAYHLLRNGIGEYRLNIGSPLPELDLAILEFESNSAKERFIEEKLGDDKSYLTRKNILAFIQPDIQEVAGNARYTWGFSPNQFLSYINLVSDYSRRTGLEIVFSRDSTKNKEYFKKTEELYSKYSHK